MRDKRQMIREIEDSLGSEGTHEQAERIFARLRADGRIRFDERDGFSMQEIPEREWNKIIVEE